MTWQNGPDHAARLCTTGKRAFACVTVLSQKTVAHRLSKFVSENKFFVPNVKSAFENYTLVRNFSIHAFWHTEIYHVLFPLEKSPNIYCNVHSVRLLASTLAHLSRLGFKTCLSKTKTKTWLSKTKTKAKTQQFQDQDQDQDLLIQDQDQDQDFDVQDQDWDRDSRLTRPILEVHDWDELWQTKSHGKQKIQLTSSCTQ